MMVHVSDTIKASAPARVDLAGGTIDIWPICLLLERPAVTVNVAIDLCAHVQLEPRDDGWLEIVSEDRGERVRLPVDAVVHDRLGLATRIAGWFGVGRGLSIRMHASGPPQSGLGGSSAMAIALGGAMARLHNRTLDAGRLRETVQNLETALLGKPTGYQDYYPALEGGVNVLTATPEGISLRRIEGGDEFLARHLLVADTRIEHQSGLNNWEVVRAYLDGDERVAASLELIRDCAARMALAVEARDIDAVAEALDEEWSARRRLSPVVTNERIDALVGAARDAGALAAKVCGAGGGGCLALLVRDTADGQVGEAIEAAGGRLVETRPQPYGLVVEGTGYRK